MQRRTDTRIVFSIQRYGTDLPETTIALDPESGRIVGTAVPRGTENERLAEAILDAIGDAVLTAEEIRRRVRGDNSAITQTLRALVADGRVLQDGAGKRGDPYRYQRTFPAACCPPRGAASSEKDDIPDHGGLPDLERHAETHHEHIYPSPAA
jgi:hypothetical protein